jgi:hypothetical protein
MYSVYVEYYGHESETVRLVKDAINELLSMHNIDYSHRGYRFQEDLYDIEYTCDDIETAELVQDKIKNIPNLYRFEFTKEGVAKQSAVAPSEGNS